MKNILIMFALLALLAMSCSKEEGNMVTSTEKDYRAVLSASITTKIRSKVSVDESTLHLGWESGDAVYMYQNYEDDGKLNKMNYNEENGMFEGTVSLKGGDAGVFLMFPSYRVTAKSGNSDVILNASKNQTGLLSEIGKALLLYNSPSAVIIPEYTIDGVVLSGTVNKCLNPIIKVNVPEALSVNKVTLTAVDEDGNDIPVAGSFTFRHSENCIMSDGDKMEIFITRDGNAQISGDIYISMINAPVAVAPDNNIGRAAKIKLAVKTTESRTYTFAKAVSNLEGGKVYNMGTIPTACVTPIITSDEDGMVTIKSSPAEARIYYTIDGSQPNSSTSSLYEGPFKVSEICTVKAVAVCTGIGASSVSSKNISMITVDNPVLSLNAAGKLVASCATEGATLTYSYSTTDTPDVPETIFPDDGVELANGTYYIRVKATKETKSVETNACLRHYHLLSTENSRDISAGTSVPLGNGDFTVFNPTDATVNLHCSGHTKWALHETYYPGSLSLRFGCQTKFTASGSLYILLEQKKGIDFHYGNTTVALNNTVTTDNEYANSYTLNVTPGNTMSFNFNINSVSFVGCAWLEQGYDISSESADTTVGHEGFDGDATFTY